MQTQGVQPPPYRHLDPGVRELVRELNGHGFHTTDSGDGVSKPEIGRTFDFLHVLMVTDPINMVSEADRLAALLPTLSHPSLSVEASYRPADGAGVLFLFDPPSPPEGV
jgi:hypothetical protein